MVKKYITLLVLLLLVSFSHCQINDEEMMMVVEYAPVFKGDFKDFVQGKIIYPESAKKDLIEGVVYVSFWIDTVGFTFNHEVIKGIREDLNDEALRVAKLIEFEKPALQRGKPIVVRYVCPVKFCLKNTLIYSQVDSVEYIEPCTNNLFSQERYPTLYQPEDSCFCSKYNGVEKLPPGVTAKLIDGLNVPIETILSNLREELLNYDLKDSIGYGRLAMGLVVDKEGNIRCGIILIGRNDAIAQKAYDVLCQQKYKPAMVRGRPIISCFVFLLKKE